MTSSSSLEFGSGIKSVLSSFCLSLECVTIAHSLAKPSTCSDSLVKNYFGIKRGKYALVCPVFLNSISNAFLTLSHI